MDTPPAPARTSPPPMPKGQKIVIGIAIVISASLTLMIAWWSVKQKVEGVQEKFQRSATQAGIAEGFKNSAEQLNKQGPHMIDDDTRMERVEVDGINLTYFMSTPAMDSKNGKMKEIAAALPTAIRTGLCADKDAKASIDAGATFKYIFKTSDDVVITEFDVNSDECKLL